jgi:hypothetical protein
MVSILVPKLGPITNPILILIHESNPKLNPISIGFLPIEPKTAKNIGIILTSLATFSFYDKSLSLGNKKLFCK